MRATRLTERRAEPLLLLTGTALSRVCRLCRKAKQDENRRKIAPTMLRERTAQRKLDFSIPGRDLVSILVSSVCSQACQDALSGVPGYPWRPSGRSRGAPGMLRDAPETLLRRLRDALGRHGVSGEGPGNDFSSILGVPRCLRGSIFAMIFV